MFLKKPQDKDLLVTLNRDSTGHADVQLRDGSVDITSISPRRMTLTAIVEKLPSNGKSKMTDAQQDENVEPLLGDVNSQNQKKIWRVVTTQTEKDKIEVADLADAGDLVGHKLDVYVSHVLSRHWIRWKAIGSLVLEHSVSLDTQTAQSQLVTVVCSRRLLASPQVMALTPSTYWTPACQ